MTPSWSQLLSEGSGLFPINPETDGAPATHTHNLNNNINTSNQVFEVVISCVILTLGYPDWPDHKSAESQCGCKGHTPCDDDHDVVVEPHTRLTAQLRAAQGDRSKTYECCTGSQNTEHTQNLSYPLPSPAGLQSDPLQIGRAHV